MPEQPIAISADPNKNSLAKETFLLACSPGRSGRISLRTLRGICILLSILAFSAAIAPGQTTRPKILGITSVRISCNEACKDEAFYSALFPIVGDCRWCGKLPGTKLGRAETPFFINDSQELLLTKSSPKPDTDGLAEITFATGDIKLLKRYLAEHGIEPTGSAGDGAIEVNDPEGHHIQFVQPSEKRLTYSHKALSMRIIHAGFVVHDRAAEDHFYKDILGFHLYWHGGMKNDVTDWVDMQVPDGTDWIEYMLNIPADASHRLLGVMNHFALGVPDIHAAEQQLLKNGMKLTEQPKIGRDGKWQLNLYDPDDTRVELMEFTPVEKPCCSEFTGPHPGPKR
jgi:catechol 2,3-dioxygenase-like lactoylglutathione lyase family enzyme